MRRPAALPPTTPARQRCLLLTLLLGVLVLHWQDPNAITLFSLPPPPPPLPCTGPTLLQERPQYLYHFVLHAALDAVEEQEWHSNSMHLGVVDRFNNLQARTRRTLGWQQWQGGSRGGSRGGSPGLCRLAWPLAGRPGRRSVGQLGCYLRPAVR